MFPFLPIEKVQRVWFLVERMSKDITVVPFDQLKKYLKRTCFEFVQKWTNWKEKSMKFWFQIGKVIKFVEI